VRGRLESAEFSIHAPVGPGFRHPIEIMARGRRGQFVHKKFAHRLRPNPGGGRGKAGFAAAGRPGHGLARLQGKIWKLFLIAGVFFLTTSNPSMKSILKLSLAALLLGLPIANLLRADDQSGPDQTGPSIQPDQPPPPPTGETPSHPHMPNPQRMLQKLSEQVNLTDDQKAKILPLLQAQADQIKALHDNASLSDDDKHEQIHAIMQSTRKQIGALLTPEQKAKLKSMHGGGHANDNPPPPPPTDNPSADAPPADNPPPPPN
jgi:protein CpxP